MSFPALVLSPRNIGLARRRAAFTLMELMVTMGVGILLIVFLFQLFNATYKAWSNGEDQSDTYREARAAMQIMVRDIGQTVATFPTNAYASPWPSPSPTPGVSKIPVLVLDHHTSPDPTPPDVVNGLPINEELYCLTNNPSNPNTGVSNLCAVGYFCMWMPDLVPVGDPQYAQKYAAAPHAYALVRQFLGSGSPTSSSTASPSPTPGVPGLFDCFQAASVKGKTTLDFIDVYARLRPPTTPGPAASVPPSATGTQLASYVWDLQFRTPTTLITPGAVSSAPYLSSPTPDPNGNNGYSNTLPAYIEIRFKALSARAGRKLEGNNSVGPTDWHDSKANSTVYQQLIAPGTRQFVARVPLGTASSTSMP